MAAGREFAVERDDARGEFAVLGENRRNIAVVKVVVFGDEGAERIVAGNRARINPSQIEPRRQV